MIREHPSEAEQLELTAGAGIYSGINDFPVGEWTIIQATFNGASSELLKDGTSKATGNAGTNTAIIMQIGASNGDPSEFTIKEFIVMARLNSSSNQSAITNYLNNKYSVY